jgi:hypothetical protein
MVVRVGKGREVEAMGAMMEAGWHGVGYHWGRGRWFWAKGATFVVVERRK